MSILWYGLQAYRFLYVTMIEAVDHCRSLSIVLAYKENPFLSKTYHLSKPQYQVHCPFTFSLPSEKVPLPTLQCVP